MEELSLQLLLLVPALVLIALGVAGLALPALPGAPLLFAGLVCAAWAENFEYVGSWTIGILAVLAVLTYLVDVIAGAMGAKRYGASGRAIAGATVGAIVGIFFGLLGVLLGPFLGAMLGELTVTKEFRSSAKAGYGAAVGLLLGVAFKLSLAFAMLGVFGVARWM